MGEAIFARAVRAKEATTAAHYMTIAHHLNPWDQLIFSRSIDARMAAASTSEVYVQIVAECEREAEDNLRHHPADSYASEIAGRMVLMAAMVGLPKNPEHAMEYFEQAQRLAPTYPEIMQRRISLANALGDSEAAKHAKMDLRKAMVWECGT